MLEQDAEKLHDGGRRFRRAAFRQGLGKGAVGHRLDLAKQGEDGRRQLAVGTSREIPDLAEFGGGRGVGSGKIENGLVPQDAVARQVAALRLGLAPFGKMHHPAQLHRLHVPHLDPLPGIGRRGVICGRIGQLGVFVVQPACPAFLLKLCKQLRIHLGKIDDVIKRIADLARAQRAPRPVGETRALVDVLFQNSAHQPVIADLVAMAQHHGRDLGIEKRQRQLSHFLEEDLEILIRRVKHLGDGFIGHEIPQRLQVDPRCQRVDRRRMGAVADLDQAQLRVVGLLAHEFGIHREELGAGETLCKRRHVRRRRDDIFRRW